MSTEELMQEYITVVLELDDGTEEEFAIVDEFEKNGENYVLLSVINGDTVSEDPEDMLFMKNDTDDSCEEDEIKLTVIDDEDEYEDLVAFYTEEEE